MIEKQQKTLFRRRITAIIVATALIVILIPTLIIVNYMVKFESFYDVDETKYTIKYKDGIYAMYDSDGALLDTDEEYGYYITKLGTLVEVDPETGVYEIIAVVDTVENESLTNNSRLLMFPHIEREQARSLEIVNSTGTIKFLRYDITADKPDDSCDFIIDGSPFVKYDPEIFSSLFVSAAYSITSEKIADPIKDANGNFSEYGLVDEVRVDEDGNEYNYSPTYYVLTDKSGNKYKVIIGDPLVTGTGYYVQYVNIDGETESKRDAVYVVGTTVGEIMAKSAEEFATPAVVYPMSLNSYFDVENFTITKKGVEKPVVGFSFIDLADRQNTTQVHSPYVFTKDSLEGYLPNYNSMYSTLYNLYSTTFVGVTHLAPTDEELIECGLAIAVEKDGEQTIEFAPEYRITFNYDVLDENNKYVQTIHQLVMISEKNENGNYYAYSIFSRVNGDKTEFMYSYDMIVEVQYDSFNFLEWDSYDWINPNIFDYNIAFVESMKIESPNYSASFILDNSKNTTDDITNTQNLEIVGTDTNGNSLRTFSCLNVIDKNRNIWTITPSDITAVNSAGVKQTISTAYNAYNALDKQVKVVSGYIEAADGTRVEVSANEVTVTAPNGAKTVFVRYATDLFRRYYQTLVLSSVEESYVMSAEEETALTADESKLLLTITAKTVEGEEKVFKFYSLTSRKAYMTLNGTGGFYILSNRVDKFISDAERFFNYELIEPYSKH